MKKNRAFRIWFAFFYCVLRDGQVFFIKIFRLNININKIYFIINYDIKWSQKFYYTDKKTYLIFKSSC